MKNNKITIITVITVICCTMCALCLNSFKEAEPQDADIQLAEGWYIMSSADTDLNGEQLTTEGIDFGTGWYEASVPSTVMGALT